MAHTQKTALLDPQTWDLQLDANGDIKLCTGAQAIVQNAANEIRLWRNDAYFQQDRGIAWKEAQLAKKLDISVLIQVIREAVANVPDIVSVDDVEIDEFDESSRELHGRINVTTVLNQQVSARF